MGLRDRYITALVARCAVAVPRECNTQQPATLLRVAPPRETQHATTAPTLDALALCAPLHATNDATTTQRTQPADHQAKVERHACPDCQQLLRHGTCAEPVAAGLLTEAEGFGIVWPPAGYAETCASYSSKTTTASERCAYRDPAAPQRRLDIARKEQ